MNWVGPRCSLPEEGIKIRIDEIIRNNFDHVVVENFEGGGIEVTIGKEDLLSTLNQLKGEGYDHLALISCVDRIEVEKFELVYFLSSYTTDALTTKDLPRVLVKVNVPRVDPVLISSIEVFPSGEPYERELHEMFGIEFHGHPRLEPLFLERDFEVPPMRKDFDPEEYVEKEFESIPPVEE